jgi:hypothetical protein
MPRKTANNQNLTAAKRAKNDCFYTQLKDIENELQHYTKHFPGKTIFCNCDSPDSNFVKFFTDNFHRLGLKKLIAVGYVEGGPGTLLTFDGTTTTVTALQGDGDFRSPESVALLQEADIIVSNPPFSLFREYVAQLTEYGKKYLIVGNVNAVTYAQIFPLIKGASCG